MKLAAANVGPELREFAEAQIGALAKEHGVSPQVLTSGLRLTNAVARVRWRVAAQLYEAGLSAQVIAGFLRADRAAVRSWLHLARRYYPTPSASS